MAGEYDREGFWNIISHVWERPPLNVLRTMIFGSDGTNAVAIKVTDNGTVVVTGSSGGGGGGDGAILDGVSAAIKATVFDYATSNPLAATLVDTNGDPVSVGGGTQYAEDTVAAAAEMLTMAGVVRKDTAATLVNTDGDRTELQVDANGRLHTIGLVTGTVTTTVASMPAITGIVTANVGLGTWPITGTVTATIAAMPDIAGTVATNYEYREDNPHFDQDKGAFIFGVRNDAQVDLTDTDGDYSPIAVDSVGRVRVALDGTTVTNEVQISGIVAQYKSADTAVTSVSAAASSVTLLSANADRAMATFFNDSTAICYVKLNSAAASATSFTVRMRAGDYYEMPYRYTGQINAIWASATGDMRITEITTAI